MTWRDEAEAWRLGLVVLDDAFAAARARLGDAVPCREGCSTCCESAALFEIHPADAALLAAGLETLPPAELSAVAHAARRVVAGLEAGASALAGEHPMLAGWTAGEGLAGLPSSAIEALAEVARGACPVLDPAGRCRLHAWRPAVCRLQGIPWEDPETGAQLPDFCRIDPRQATLAAQPLALHALDEARETTRGRLATVEAGSPAPLGRTFVAEVILRALGQPDEG